MVPSSVTVATVSIVSMRPPGTSYNRFIRSRRLRRHSLPLRRLSLQVLAIPRDIPLVAVLLVARLGDAVALAGVDHQLGVAAQAPEGLVELLGVEERHGDGLRAAEDQGGSSRLLDLEEGGDPHPPLGVLPGQPQLRLPLPLVVVGAVVGEIVDLARTRGR